MLTEPDSAAGAPAAPASTPPVALDRLPVTGSQQGLLAVHTRNPGLPVYNMLVRFDLDPRHDAAALQAALTAMVAMQPAMRQVFALRPELHSRLSPPSDVVPVEQVIVPGAQFEDAVLATAHRIGPPEFDLENGPAYRFATVRADDGSASALILADHHIILDGLSLGPMVGDLEQMLTAPLSADEVASTTAARERAFAKELAAQHRTATSAAVAERSAAWAERLRAVPPLELAPGPGRPTQTSFTGTRINWLLTEAETAAVDATCRRLEVLPFVLFSGVYGAVLARHGNVPQVLVGSPFLARRTARSFDLCGFFVNTLPVTVDVDWTSPVDDFLARSVKPAVDFCRSNVDISFSQLVAGVRPDRTSNRNPLFAAMLAMQNTFTPQPGGAVRRMTEVGNETSKFDLWLGATLVDGRWLLELEYDRELIAPAIADGLLGSLRGALRQALADPSVPVADLFADASAAASTRTDGWQSRPAEPALLDWVEAVARQRPAAVAVEEPGRWLSYAELVDAAGRVAGGLADRGVGPGDVVGLAADGLCDTVTSILAILRCGAAFLPLDPALPADRLTYLLDKAASRLVVGRQLVPGPAAVPVAELAAALPAESKADPDAPVYVMFTSGSTGVPKGVLMGQRWLAQFAAWQVDAMRMDGDSRFLQYAPLGFDVCFQEIFPALVSGGTVVSREPADRRDFAAVLRRIAETEVSHVYLPVAALRPVVQLALDRGLHLPELRYLCVSGEQLLVDDQVREFFLRHPRCVLINHYGPTETNAVTTYSLSAADPRWPAHVPIGVPLPHVAAYVLDATGHLAPPGVAGELYLGGRCPAEGYVNDPELTAARFLPDPFSPAAGGGSERAVLYRTGDLVVRTERDELVFLGRLDTQVKIRGHRVELGEIEVVANRADGVRRAVAVVHGDGADREIALFVVPEEGAEPDPDRVREQLAATLPGYMRPRWIFGTESVPATSTGKTDRTALLRVLADLLAAEQQAAAEASGPPAYADELEADLAEMWSRFLGAGRIAPERPLPEYGAHSLNIFTALAEVQDRYGVEVPMAEFFATPTVATLAALVRAARPAA